MYVREHWKNPLADADLRDFQHYWRSGKRTHLRYHTYDLAIGLNPEIREAFPGIGAEWIYFERRMVFWRMSPDPFAWERIVDPVQELGPTVRWLIAKHVGGKEPTVEELPALLGMRSERVIGATGIAHALEVRREPSDALIYTHCRPGETYTLNDLRLLYTGWLDKKITRGGWPSMKYNIETYWLLDPISRRPL